MRDIWGNYLFAISLLNVKGTLHFPFTSRFILNHRISEWKTQWSVHSFEMNGNHTYFHLLISLTCKIRLYFRMLLLNKLLYYLISVDEKYVEDRPLLQSVWCGWRWLLYSCISEWGKVNVLSYLYFVSPQEHLWRQRVFHRRNCFLTHSKRNYGYLYFVSPQEHLWCPLVF